MKKIVILAFIFLFPLTALAELKLAVVDLQKALATTNAGKKAQADYQKEVKDAQSKINSKKKEFEEKRVTLEKQKDSLNKKALSTKGKELLKIEKELQNSYRESQQTLRKKNAAVVSELIKKMRSIIDAVGKEEKFSMIIDKSSQPVLFSSGVEDITDKVIKKFNASSK